MPGSPHVLPAVASRNGVTMHRDTTYMHESNGNGNPPAGNTGRKIVDAAETLIKWTSAYAATWHTAILQGVA